MMLVIKKKKANKKKNAILRKKKNSIKNGEVSGVPLLNSREVPGHKVWRSHTRSGGPTLRKPVSFLMNVFHTE